MTLLRDALDVLTGNTNAAPEIPAVPVGSLEAATGAPQVGVSVAQEASATPTPPQPPQRIVLGSDGEIEVSGVQHRVIPFKMKRNMENRHILLAGTTGSGKSRGIYQIFDVVRDRESDKALIVDHGGQNISRYYRHGDLILNPFDLRFPGWNPANEIRDEFDFENLARFVVPDGVGESKQWHHYAQILFAGIFRVSYNAAKREGRKPTKAELLHKFLVQDPKELRKELDGDPASALFMPGSEKMAANARSILGTYVGSWKNIPEGDFSIRDWITNERDHRWIYVSYKESMYSSLKGFISMVVSIAITYMLDLPENEERRVWFQLDELATLERMGALLDALTKIRKVGGCVVAGLQTLSQLQETYGRESATTLLANFNTWLCLRPGDAETAEMFSKHFGEQEIWHKEFSDNSGVGQGGVNAGESVQTKLKQQRCVTYTELMLLDNLEGGIKFPGNIPFAFIRVPIIQRPKLADPFIPRG